jgi:putative ABC transport system permease protein
MSVTERTRELGILAAIGWSPFMIARKIAWEALVLGIMACLLGDILGVGILVLFEHLNPAGFGSLVSLSRMPQVLLTSLLMAMPVALIGSIGPVIRAVRLSPVEALRFE